MKDMKQDSPEFQKAGKEACEAIRDAIVALFQQPGQDSRSALSGAAAAIVSLGIEFRPDGMPVGVAAAKVVEMTTHYCMEIIPQYSDMPSPVLN